jgi:hypothetical protein
MPHDSTPRSRTRRIRHQAAWIGIVVVVGLTLGGCRSAFNPSGPCTADGSAPGAYPDLEALVPTTFRGAPPKQLDSGRTCTKDALATLVAHGVGELRFAGATWATGTDSGLSLAVFTDASGPPLDPAWLVEFYEQGATKGTNVQSIATTDYAIGSGIAAKRIDVLNGESFQTVVVWPRGGRVAVALIGDFIREIQTRDAHDEVVKEAVDAFHG